MSSPAGMWVWKRFSEDQLESVLNLPVADVAGSGCHAEVVDTRAAIRGACNPVRRATVDAVLNDPPVRSERRVGIAEHGVVEQVEELQAELKPGFLSEHFGAMERQVPVLEDREIDVRNTGAAASARPGIGIASGLKTIPGEGLNI